MIWMNYLLFFLFFYNNVHLIAIIFLLIKGNLMFRTIEMIIEYVVHTICTVHFVNFFMSCFHCYYANFTILYGIQFSYDVVV